MGKEILLSCCDRYDCKNCSKDEPVPIYIGYSIERSEIRKACKYLRDNNHDISDNVIDFMLDAALEKMKP